MKKYTWFDHLDRKNQVNNARCVIFYAPFMDLKKLHKWYKRFTMYVFKLVCIKSKIDPNINVKRAHEIFVSFGLHVGYSILISNNLVFSKTIETEFSQGFEIMNNGELQYCLGIQFFCNYNKHFIHINQHKYVIEKLA
jgi:hypothetical protein